MEDGIERSISILLDTIHKIKTNENSNEKKKDTPTTSLEKPMESDDKKEKKD
jgi:hypothetical protein